MVSLGFQLIMVTVDLATIKVLMFRIFGASSIVGKMEDPEERADSKDTALCKNLIPSNSKDSKIL